MTELGFGDNVRVREAPETITAGIAGAPASVSGFTTPSITGVQVIGELNADYALGVTLDDGGDTYWLAPELIEFVDHAPGTEVRVQGSPLKSVRMPDGEWRTVPVSSHPDPASSRRTFWPLSVLLGFFFLGNVGVAVAAAAERTLSPSFFTLYAIGIGWAIAIWVLTDRREHSLPSSLDEGWFIFWAWPFVLPYHLLKTRGLRGCRLLVVLSAGFVAAYIFALIVYFLLRA